MADQRVQVGEADAGSGLHVFEAEAPARRAVSGLLEPHAQQLGAVERPVGLKRHTACSSNSSARARPPRTPCGSSRAQDMIALYGASSASSSSRNDAAAFAASPRLTG